MIDRNPQKFVPNIFKAVEADYLKVMQRVSHSKGQPSNLRVLVAHSK